MPLKNIIYLLFFKGFLFIFLLTCSSSHVPKPKGYPRVKYPEKNYIKGNTKDCPFTFEIPDYSSISISEYQTERDKCWYNVEIPFLNAKIYLTYLELKDNYNEQIEISRDLVMKHIKKASKIGQKVYEDSIKNIYSIIYELEGKVASPIQFSISDKKKNFLRGSLYFNMQPNYDSLEPSINYIKEDIIKIIETTEWK